MIAMPEDDSVLTQEAIDALLSSEPRSGEVPAAKPRTTNDASPSGGGGQQPTGGSSPGEAGKAKPANTDKTARELKAALQRIARLEKLVDALKQHITEAAALKTLAGRIAKLEQGAAATPVFNIYSKFTCSSCGRHGAAQVKARCGHCGKEGWFGKKA